jgi:glycosyltransferase involved in cell wall biosynthesis
MEQLNLVCPINQMGYGIASTNLLYELSKRVKVSLFPVNKESMDAPSKYHDCIRQGIKNAELYDVKSPCVRIWHQNQLDLFTGSPRVGFPIFELDTFTDVEKHHLKSCDKLFVCSEWAKSVILDNIELNAYGYRIEDNISVISLGVDRETFSPGKNMMKKTIFFNCGKWEVRKGHDLIPSIMKAALGTEDNWELWMMCDNPFPIPGGNEGWENQYKEELGNRVRFIPRLKTPYEVADIMRATDCGIFPARAEGWNLEALEMMACGKQVIITDYAGHTEFCNSDNSLLIPIAEKELAHDGYWFNGQGNWAKLNNKNNAFHTAVAHVKSIHHLKQNGCDIFNYEGIETSKKFTWVKASRKILTALEN